MILHGARARVDFLARGHRPTRRLLLASAAEGLSAPREARWPRWAWPVAGFAFGVLCALCVGLWALAGVGL